MGSNVNLSGTPFGRYLAQLVKRLEDPSELFGEIGAAMSASTMLRIDSGMDVDGRPFVPSVRAREQGGQTLRDTSRMRSAITYLASRRGVEWGVSADVPYAAILNTGGVIRAKSAHGLVFKVGGRWVRKMSVTIPRRKFVGFSLVDKQEVIDIVYSYLAGR